MASPHANSSQPAARILCADDEPAIRDVMCALLRREGYVAESVSNGLEAWKRFSAKDGRFDLLITDNDMPGLTGSGLVQMIREAGLPVKIVVFSASLTPGDQEVFRAWQVDALVTKGSPIDELLRTVRQVLDGTRVGAREKFGG